MLTTRRAPRADSVISDGVKPTTPPQIEVASSATSARKSIENSSVVPQIAVNSSAPAVRETTETSFVAPPTPMSTRKRKRNDLDTDAKPALTGGKREPEQRYLWGKRWYKVMGDENPEWLQTVEWFNVDADDGAGESCNKRRRVRTPSLKLRE